MTHDDARLTRTPVPFSILGKDVQIQAFSDGQFIEFDAWLRGLLTTRLQSSGLRRDALSDAAMKTVSVHAFDGGPGTQLMSTPEGVAKLMLMSLMNPPAGLSYDALLAFYRRPQERVRAAEMWRDLNMGELKAQEEEPQMEPEPYIQGDE